MTGARLLLPFSRTMCEIPVPCSRVDERLGAVEAAR
jgi:hypothetical protein